MNDPIQKEIFITNKSQNVLKICREAYMRDDITCRSRICNKCSQIRPPLLEFPPVYIFPSFKVIVDFLDIFENGDIQNIVFCETIRKELQEINYNRSIDDIMYLNLHILFKKFS